MIELNQEIRYKNRTLMPYLVENGQVLCFNEKGLSEGFPISFFNDYSAPIIASTISVVPTSIPKIKITKKVNAVTSTNVAGAIPKENITTDIVESPIILSQTPISKEKILTPTVTIPTEDYLTEIPTVVNVVAKPVAIASFTNEMEKQIITKSVTEENDEYI